MTKRSGARKSRRFSFADATALQFARRQLAIVTGAQAKAIKRDSFIAVAQLSKLAMDLKAAVQVAEEAEAGLDPTTDLTDDQILNQVILPAIASWPRTMLEELWAQVGSRLGVAGVVATKLSESSDTLEA
jgi:hypothetical protein